MRSSAPLTSVLARRWADLEARDRRVDALDFRAGLLLENAIILYQFAEGVGLAVPPEDPALERRYLESHSRFIQAHTAIRKIQDRQWGARWNGKDFDAIDPTGGGPELGAVFIPIMIGVGVVALAGLVARFVWLEKETTEIGDKYNKLLKTTNDRFCADPTSDTCQSWEEEKLESNYAKNETMSDRIKGAVGAVGSGLGKGLMIALPLIAAAFIWRSRR